MTITSSLFSCGSTFTLTGNYTGSGTATYSWTIPPSSTVIGSASTITVSPTVTTTYQLEVTGSTCPTKTPVTIFYYPTASTISAGPDRSICEATHSVIIGTVAAAGATYSWAPSGSLSNPTLAQPTATVSSNVTYTMTVTDKCGNISSDQMVVFYDPFCPHRMISPEAAAAAENGVVSIYPNPGNGSFTVETHSSASKTIQVFDMMGKLVFAAEQTTESIIPIDIIEQPAGIYMVRVVTGNSVETQKLIKQ